MLRVGRWVVLVMVVFGVLPPGAPAEAGGATFNFHRQWFAPGEQAYGKTEFSAEVDAKTGRVADGPYFAYLLHSDRFIEPPHVPSNAIRLGQVRMRPLNDGIWEASIRFLVPNVRPGSYTVSVCNDPCRDAFVGDLVGAWIFVAASAEQAKMRNLEARIEERLGQQISDTTSDLQEQLDSLREGVESPRISVGTELRLSRLEDQIKVMDTEVRDLRKQGDQGALAWLWLAGWIAAAGIAVLWRTTAQHRRPKPTTKSSDDVAWNESAPIYPDDIDGRDRSVEPGELVSR
ncbi:MAG TPA: hypothetical protein VGL18_04380 [Actinomycetota bacterium]|jgi:hypothetical protein